MSLHIERRATPRSETAVRVEALDGGPQMVAHDISLGGMMVTCAEPRWPGMQIAVRFKLPGQKQAIRTTCRVVDLVDVPHGVGLTLRFLKLGSAAKLAIHDYVDLRPLPSGAHDEESGMMQIERWVGRILEDCEELRALSRA